MSVSQLTQQVLSKCMPFKIILLRKGIDPVKRQQMKLADCVKLDNPLGADALTWATTCKLHPWKRCVFHTIHLVEKRKIVVSGGWPPWGVDAMNLFTHPPHGGGREWSEKKVFHHNILMFFIVSERKGAKDKKMRHLSWYLKHYVAYVYVLFYRRQHKCKHGPLIPGWLFWRKYMENYISFCLVMWFIRISWNRVPTWID